MTKKLISLSNLTRFKDYLNLAFEAVSEALTGKTDEAPKDGKQYARKDGDWEEVESGTSLEWLTDAEINAMFES